MKLWLVAAFLLCLSLPAALGLKCYRCSNARSWDECKSTRTSHLCPNGFDRCAKVYFKSGGVESFSKYCLPNAKCNKDANPTCKGATGSYTCNIYCCDGDDCNAGSAFGISGILLLTCALASLIFLLKA
ncbi:uncharacterized protein LOC144636544 isoform X2 [Oculina patagonica]